MAEARADLLQRVPLFSGLDRKEAQELSRTLKERAFSAGDVIAQEGERGIGFFLIESGTAKVTVGGEDRITLGPGDHFGEIALVDEGPRTATVTAESELKCWGLTSWEFRPLVETNASIAWKLLEALAKRVRALESR